MALPDQRADPAAEPVVSDSHDDAHLEDAESPEDRVDQRAEVWLSEDRRKARRATAAPPLISRSPFTCSESI
jgi:hypothetical protein